MPGPKKSYCIRGHYLDDDANTSIRSDGHRRCRLCHNDRALERSPRNRVRLAIRGEEESVIDRLHIRELPELLFVCKNCGAGFNARVVAGKAKFCSAACREKDRRKRLAEKKGKAAA